MAEEEESNLVTVFASGSKSKSRGSKGTFDSISFSVPKKERESSITSPVSSSSSTTVPPPLPVYMDPMIMSSLADDLQSGDNVQTVTDPCTNNILTEKRLSEDVRTVSAVEVETKDSSLQNVSSELPIASQSTNKTSLKDILDELDDEAIELTDADDANLLTEAEIAEMLENLELGVDPTLDHLEKTPNFIDPLGAHTSSTTVEGNLSSSSVPGDEGSIAVSQQPDNNNVDNPLSDQAVNEDIPSNSGDTAVYTQARANNTLDIEVKDYQAGDSTDSTFDTQCYIPTHEVIAVPVSEVPPSTITTENLDSAPNTLNSPSENAMEHSTVELPLQTYVTSEEQAVKVDSCDDDIYNAWIHENTSTTKDNLTTPGIVYEDDMVDKVTVNMHRIFGETEASRRRILTADSVVQNENGIQELIKLGCFRSAINLTKRILTGLGQGPGSIGQSSVNTPYSLQVWFTRIALLVRIREFAIAESEVDAFQSFINPDMYYAYYPALAEEKSGKKGSLVPFNFRILVAELPQYSRRYNETSDRLNSLLSTVRKIISNMESGLIEDGSEKSQDEARKEKSLQIWRQRELRILYSLVNTSLLSKDYYNAFTQLEILTHVDKEHLPQLKSAIGRLFLQHGDVTTAQKYFIEAADHRTGNTDTEQVDTLVDSALASIAQNSYPEAFTFLQQAAQIQPDNFMVINNMSVCLMYMGKVKEALNLLESTVKQNPPQLLQENIILNLATIFELENSDGHKKNALLKLISEYKGDGINLAALKMPNLI